jgi:hypothetical protein
LIVLDSVLITNNLADLLARRHLENFAVFIIEFLANLFSNAGHAIGFARGNISEAGESFSTGNTGSKEFGAK